ncbi:MAG: hypothetical protein IPL61_16855 [Myxococcales bacterium]|nr:hypothetical protein [Myxococcales bacterium]
MQRGALPRAWSPRSALRGLALASTLAASGCSLVLDFDKPVDAAPTDAPVTPAQCAANEPNDSPATATAWVGVDIDAAICGDGDVDYYAISLVDGQPIRASITFMNRGGAGDLDLRLLTVDGGMVLDESKTSGDTELVLCPGGSPCPPITGGTYLLEIKGFTAAVQSAYTLHIEMTADVDAGVDADVDAI